MNLDLFKKIISINSIYPNEEALGSFLIGILEENGFVVKKQYIDPEYQTDPIDASRYNIVATKGNHDKSICFYAHMDTVPVHDKLLRKTDPFELTVDAKDEDIAYGLGSVDMKSGLFAILESTKDNQFKDYTTKIIFGCDEECWSKGSHSLIKSSFLDDVELMIVPEIGTAPITKTNAKNIILGRRGRSLIRVLVPGKSCHGAIAEKEGINAITQASVLSKHIDNYFQQTQDDGILPKGNQFVKSIHGTTSSLSVPDQVELIIDRHIVSDETPENTVQEIKEIIKTLIKEGKLKDIKGVPFIVELFDRPTPIPKAYITDKNDPMVSTLIKSTESIFGEVNLCYGYSIADENIFAQIGKPIVTLGPVGGNEHGSNERVSLSSIKKLIETYKLFLKQY